MGQGESLGKTLGQKIATAFWAPKATKSQAPHDTLFTILLQPAPMNSLFTSAPPFIDMVTERENVEIYRRSAKFRPDEAGKKMESCRWGAPANLYVPWPQVHT